MILAERAEAQLELAPEELAPAFFASGFTTLFASLFTTPLASLLAFIRVVGREIEPQWL